MFLFTPKLCSFFQTLKIRCHDRMTIYLLCTAADFMLCPLFREGKVVKGWKWLALSQHQNKKMPLPICNRSDMYVLPEFGQEGRGGTAGEGKEGCLFVYLYPPQTRFLQARILAKSIYKVQPGDRENYSSHAARGLVLSIRPATDVSCFLLHCAGPSAMLWGRQSWGEHRKNTS